MNLDALTLETQRLLWRPTCKYGFEEFAAFQAGQTKAEWLERRERL